MKYFSPWLPLHVKLLFQAVIRILESEFPSWILLNGPVFLLPQLPPSALPSPFIRGSKADRELLSWEWRVSLQEVPACFFLWAPWGRKPAELGWVPPARLNQGCSISGYSLRWQLHLESSASSIHWVGLPFPKFRMARTELMVLRPGYAGLGKPRTSCAVFWAEKAPSSQDRQGGNWGRKSELGQLRERQVEKREVAQWGERGGQNWPGLPLSSSTTPQAS
jgi:hypothetical protein